MLRRPPKGVTIGRGAQVPRSVVFDVAPGARLTIGDDARIGPRCRFHVAAGEVRVGARARLGERCVVSAHERVEIGDGAILDDEVVLVDFDPVDDDPERPIREQGLITAPVVVGAGAILDRGASVQRGAAVAAGARVTAHEVVTA
jgi:carbonic anhydrase/acetyltransferase-like protein (isoleucine patch superfamily)